VGIEGHVDSRFDEGTDAAEGFILAIAVGRAISSAAPWGQKLGMKPVMAFWHSVLSSGVHAFAASLKTFAVKVLTVSHSHVHCSFLRMPRRFSPLRVTRSCSAACIAKVLILPR